MEDWVCFGLWLYCGYEVCGIEFFVGFLFDSVVLGGWDFVGCC